MRTYVTFAGALAVVFCAMGGEAAPPVFTRKPTAVKDGDKVTIAFAADRETDVAVSIENGQGKVVRHLVAGRLGKNAPAPLKPNALEQTLVWDGQADYA